MPVFTELEDVRLSYDPRTDTVRLSASDPRLDKESFVVVLPNGSRPNTLARKILEEEGAQLKPQTPAPDAPRTGSVVPSEEERTAFYQAADANPAVDAPLRPKGKRPVPLGVTTKGVPVELFENEVRTHVGIFGSTGSGRSKVVETIAGGLLDLGWNGTILDLKEDTEPGGLRDWFDTYTKTHAQPYQEVLASSDKSEVFFNPLTGLTAEQARDAVLSTMSFEAGYYEAINKQLLGELFTLIITANAQDPKTCPLPTMEELGRILGANRLDIALKPYLAVVTLTTSLDRSSFPALTGHDKNFDAAARGLGARLNAEYSLNGAIGLKRPLTERPHLDLNAEGVTYISASIGGKRSVAQLISYGTLQQVINFTAERLTRAPQGGKSADAPRFLIIDEADQVDRRLLGILVSRARSAGIAVIMSSQSPLEWKTGSKSPEDIFANTNVFIVMNQGGADAARLGAEILNQGYRDQVIGHNELQTLAIGEALMRVDRPQERLTWVKANMRDPQA